MKDAQLYWQPYRLFPYEKKLGRREAEVLLQPEELIENRYGLLAKNCQCTENLDDLVYFASYAIDGQLHNTLQAKRERNQEQKQNTRYYSHGIHEYKGKFNPQIVRAIMNISRCNRQKSILDPFCGSGTSLLEAELQGCIAYGVDINPMATFIASVKTEIISSKQTILHFDYDTFMQEVQQQSKQQITTDNARTQYLRNWFLPEILQCIEAWKAKADTITNKALRGLLLLSVSNILRDYSEQEPSDLRIRRRTSPYPKEDIWEAIKKNFQKSVAKIAELHDEDIVPPTIEPVILNHSIKNIRSKDFPQFDLAVTSPPYATALPYIDTQRFSIVWLGLDTPQNIRALECSLIGSRETMSKYERDQCLRDMTENRYQLCESVFDFCTSLQRRLSMNDGFRKQHTPFLLYRYFAEMAEMFEAIHPVLKPDAYYCLVVGYNKTNIGGETTVIDTPSLLADEAKAKGFTLQEIFPLETYQRYGLHAKRAITGEALIILKA